MRRIRGMGIDPANHIGSLELGQRASCAKTSQGRTSSRSRMHQNRRNRRRRLSGFDPWSACSKSWGVRCASLIFSRSSKSTAAIGSPHQLGVISCRMSVHSRPMLQNIRRAPQWRLTHINPTGAPSLRVGDRFPSPRTEATSRRATKFPNVGMSLSSMRSGGQAEADTVPRPECAYPNLRGAAAAARRGAK